jgi:RNA polymerase-binding transcription factor DksA
MKKSSQRGSDISGKEPQSETAWILGRSPDAENDPHLTTVEPKSHTYYERLPNIRNDLANQRAHWHEQELETQPKDRQQADAESATTVAMRDAALGRVQGYERLLCEVNEAIRRIKDGRYGICELTGQPIEMERLDAEPWTAYSIEGQRQAEADGSSAISFNEGGL